MTREEVIQHLLQKQSYIKDANIKRIAKACKVSYKEAKEALREAKLRIGAKPGYGKRKAGEELSDYLDRHNLELGDVKKIKIYGNTDKPMFSVETRNEWYGEQAKEFKSELEEMLREYKSPEFKPIVLEHSETIGVINLLDAHIDKLTLVDETGYGSSLESNVQMFEDAFDSLLSQILVYNPEFVVIVVGSDFYNANDSNNTTKRGTPQNSEADWKTGFKEGYKVVRRCIDKALQHTKVMIKTIKGNHDEDKIFFLGELLQVAYEDTPNIVLDTMTKQRKYIHYGVNLIGLAHGDKEKGYVASLPATMMIENKSYMPQVEHCYFYLGDIHHKEEYQYKRSQDLKGCEVFFLRALSNLSKWEYENGYVGIPKTAEGFIHHKKRGMINNIRVHI